MPPLFIPTLPLGEEMILPTFPIAGLRDFPEVMTSCAPFVQMSLELQANVSLTEAIC